MTDLIEQADLSEKYLSGRGASSTNATLAKLRLDVDAAAKAKGLHADPAGKGATDKAAVAGGDEALNTEGGIAGTLSSVARHVSEIPRQAFGGGRDAIQHSMEAVQDFSDFLDENVADLSAFETEEFNLPDVDQPKTMTGSVTRGIAEFLTGFLPTLRVLKPLGAFTGGMTAGGVADYFTSNPEAKRLSDHWESVGLPPNALIEYLQTSPDDTAADARLKNIYEGALVGGPLDLAIRGLGAAARGLRGAANRSGAGQLDEASRSLEEQRMAYGEVHDRDIMPLGDPNEPLFKVLPKAPESGSKKAANALNDTETGVPEDVAANGLVRAGSVKSGDVFINFSKIDTAEDVQSLMGQMADAFSGSVKKAQRGVQSNEATKELADELGMTVPDLLSRRKGQPFNAEEAVAARKIWAASGEKLLELAERAADPNAGTLDQFMFRKMMATHYAVQAEVIGARTETARALQAWSIPVGGSVEKARDIQLLIEGMGGPDASAEMARRLAILKHEGASPESLSKFVREGWGATTANAVREVWVNGLLSSPKTHLVNITSNTGVAVLQVFERAVARGFAKVSGGGADHVAPGEAVAMAHGMVSSLKDAFILAAKAVRTGDSGFALNKIDLPREKAVSAEAFRLDGTGAMGRTVDFLGEVFGVSGRLLGAEDEFFKTIGYRAELHAQALRQARADILSDPSFAKATTKEQNRAVADRMAKIISKPPEHIRIASADAALYSTFTNKPGKFAESILKLRESGGFLNPLPFIIPFARTPANIARFAFERSPLAPLTKQWRDDIAAGGARRDLALARISTGTTIMMLTADYVDSGLVSGRGPEDSAERAAKMRTGWRPYSLHIGDKWVSYNRADPFGMTMGFAADVTEALRRGEIDPGDMDEWNELVAAGIAAVSQVTINKTYMSGMADFVEVMSDPERYGERYINNFAGSFIPFSSALRAVEGAVDPTRTEVNSPLDAYLEKLPGLSARLQKRRNLWGKAIKPNSGLGVAYDTLSPVVVSKDDAEPVDAEMVALGMGVTKIRKKTTFDGVDVNLKDWPEVYDEYVRLAGNEIKHPVYGMGALDFLNSVVEGRSEFSEIYNLRTDGAEGGKASYIKDTIRKYRLLAQDAILADDRFADFTNHLATLKTRQKNRRRKMNIQ